MSVDIDTLILFSDRIVDYTNDEYFVIYKWYYKNAKYGAFGYGQTEIEATEEAKKNVAKWIDTYVI